MKKTMFITSVIMVVVMAIALTTSSLAWFTAAGDTKVTTTAMTLTAEATSAEGLLISQVDTGDWSESIDLIDGNAFAHMMPSTPYAYAEGKGFIDAMVADQFIANTIDMNGNYSTADPVTANSQNANLYFSDTFFITTVDTDNNLYVTPTITWTKEDANSWKPYTTDSTVSGRIAPASSDPIIYVAVLASKLTYSAANQNPASKTWTTEAAAVSSNWEILNVFSSKGGQTVNFGVSAAAFQTEDEDDPAVVISSNSAKTISTISTASNKTTTALAKVTTHYQSGEALSTGEVRVYKVLAWYDGYTLQNSNSNFALRFALTFTASH